MKRLFCVILLVLCLTGCSGNPFSSGAASVETLKSWQFQYNSSTDDYSVFFALLDKNGKYVDADVDVDIRIEDEDGNEIFNSLRSVTRKDFGYYSSQIAGEQYLANIRIEKSEIKEGVSSSGTVYMSVYKEGILDFGEVQFDATYCLPVKAFNIKMEQLPVEVAVKDYGGRTTAKFQIEDMQFKNISDYQPIVTITLSGTKTYGSATKYSYDMFEYKLYDSGGYVVKSGQVMLSSLDEGDKFKDSSIMLYELTPGEEYTLKLLTYDW